MVLLANPEHALIGPAVGSLLALLFLWLGLRANRRLRLVTNLPTSKTTGVFIGLVELKGTAEVDRPLTSFMAERACVEYRWSVEEHWSRTVTETYTDSKGNTRTRTRRESGWKTVASGGEKIPFYLRDDHGVIRIRPEGAEIQNECVFSEICYPSDPLYYGKGPEHAVSDSDHYRRFSEHAIPLHHPIYVMGQARERADIVAAEIAHDDQAKMFLISTRSEEGVSRSFRLRAWMWTMVGMIVCGIGWAVGLSIRHAQADNSMMIGVGLASGGGYLLVWAIGWIWMVFNSMIDLGNRVKQAWANVDIQLKRRHDLIPRLVKIVEGFRDHEQKVQHLLAELRSQAQATQPGRAGPDPQGCSGRLIGLVEAYPQLKSDGVFTQLQDQLIETEQRIALSRAYYNDITEQLNTRLGTIPDGWVGGLARLTPQGYIDATDFERAPVVVNFAE